MDAEESTDICDVLSKFQNTSCETNVKFEVQCGQTWVPFVAHKLVLSIWSPVFAEKFYLKETEINNIIEITDVLPSAFNTLLRFMYGSSTLLQGREAKFIYEVYKAAEKYQVEKLRKSCTEILTSATINPDNVFELLEIGNHLNMECLKLRCFKLLQYETAEVFESQNVQNVTPDIVMSIIKLSSLSLSSEYELLSWLYDWLESEHVKYPYKTPQFIVEPFLPYLNFTSLKAQEFAKLINRHKKFFDKIDCFSILMNILDPCPDCVDLPLWHIKNKILRCYKPQNDKSSQNFADHSKNITSQTRNSLNDCSIHETKNNSFEYPSILKTYAVAKKKMESKEEFSKTEEKLLFFSGSNENVSSKDMTSQSIDLEQRGFKAKTKIQENLNSFINVEIENLIKTSASVKVNNQQSDYNIKENRETEENCEDDHRKFQGYRRAQEKWSDRNEKVQEGSDCNRKENRETEENCKGDHGKFQGYRRAQKNWIDRHKKVQENSDYGKFFEYRRGQVKWRDGHEKFQGYWNREHSWREEQEKFQGYWRREKNRTGDSKKFQGYNTKGKNWRDDCLGFCDK